MKIKMRMPLKIRMQTYLAGVNHAFSPGDETDQFSEAEAIRLIERGYAVPVPDSKVERAVEPKPAERRNSPRRKKEQ